MYYHLQHRISHKESRSHLDSPVLGLAGHLHTCPPRLWKGRSTSKSRAGASQPFPLQTSSIFITIASVRYLGLHLGGWIQSPYHHHDTPTLVRVAPRLTQALAALPESRAESSTCSAPPALSITLPCTIFLALFSDCVRSRPCHGRKVSSSLQSFLLWYSSSQELIKVFTEIVTARGVLSYVNC